MDEDDERIVIHSAKCVLDGNCFIYKQTVLNLVKIGTIARISYSLTEDTELWSHDSPYVKIIQLSTKKDEYLCEIVNINRIVSNSYPLNIGERLWISKQNIIEIPIDYQPNRTDFEKYISDKKVLCSGPLYCIDISDYDTDSSDSDAEDFSSASDSD